MLKSVKVLLTIVLVVILVLLVWFFFVKDVWQSNQFTVTCNGKTLADNKKLDVNVGTVYEFKIEDGSATDKQSYSVKLVAHNSKTTFNIDGRKVKFADIDLTDDFVSNVTKQGFTFCQQKNLRTLLLEKFNGNTFTSTNESIVFDLVVTSANGKNVVKIPLYYNSISDITIVPPHVVY